MQSVPNFPTDLTVTEPQAVVAVNGVPLEVTSVSVSRALSSTLPDQASEGSGMAAATGDVTWAGGPLVSHKTASPWSPSSFLPKPSDKVTVDLGYRNALVRQLTGVVDSASGSITSDTAGSNLVDHIDKLDRTVSFPPHMSVMPPWVDGGDFLLVNNSPLFTTDRVLRACGFNATPPIDTGCILSVPLMGSAWPEVGRVDSASQQGFPTFPPSFNASQWGLACNSIEASYTPDTSNWATGRLDKNFQITLVARDVTANTGDFAVRAWWGTTRVSLAVTSDRRVVAVCFDGTTGTQVCSLSTAAAWTADVFTLRVNPGGGFTIYANNGATTTGSIALPSAMTTTNISRVQITSPHETGVHCGGVQVAFSTAATYSRPRTAVLTPPASNLGLPAMPAINGRNALEVLKEQATAECAAIQIDEYGVFRFVNRKILTLAEAVETLNPLDDYYEFGWESDSKSVRAGVDLRSSQARITRFPVSSVTLYQGSGQSLRSGETVTDIIESGGDESWFNVAPPEWTRPGLNRGEGTMLGGVISKDETPDVWAYDAGKLTYTFEMMTTEKVAITHTAGTLAAGETLILKTSETDTFLRPFRRDKSLPIVRGKARVRWTDIITTGVYTGPADASRLEHYVGPWIQDPEELKELATWLSIQLTRPNPVIRNLNVVPDPRRQLGDIVWVEDVDNLQVKLKVLVTSLSITASDGSMEQTIGGRILQTISLGGTTNEELDIHAGGYTNAAFDSLWADRTNAQLDANPLERG